MLAPRELRDMRHLKHCEQPRARSKSRREKRGEAQNAKVPILDKTRVLVEAVSTCVEHSVLRQAMHFGAKTTSFLQN
jgi:hypothetical protein